MLGLTISPRWSGPRCLVVIKWTLLMALLVAHFLTRHQTAKTMYQQPAFYQDTHNYVESYRSSLGLLAGRGFCRLGFPCDHQADRSDGGEPPNSNRLLDCPD